MPSELKQIQSSWIEAVGYDEATQELTVVYKRGGGDTFIGVPPDIAAGFDGAESPGVYFRHNVRGAFERKPAEDGEAEG